MRQSFTGQCQFLPGLRNCLRAESRKGPVSCPASACSSLFQPSRSVRRTAARAQSGKRLKRYGLPCYFSYLFLPLRGNNRPADFRLAHSKRTVRANGRRGRSLNAFGKLHERKRKDRRNNGFTAVRTERRKVNHSRRKCSNDL